ncbi:MAG TPA: hypothetical protein VF939_06950 [Puia sp.]
MIQLFKRVVVIVDGKKGQEIDKVILRYLDVLVVAFDYAKHKNDEITIKLIFSGLNSCSDLIAKWRMGRELIEHQFEVIHNIVKNLLEQEKEQLVEEAFWAYYHMAQPQILRNLPPEDKTLCANTYIIMTMRSGALYPFSDPAKMFRGDAQVGSYIILRYALDNSGLLLYHGKILQLRGIGQQPVFFLFRYQESCSAISLPARSQVLLLAYKCCNES